MRFIKLTELHYDEQVRLNTSFIHSYKGFTINGVEHTVICMVDDEPIDVKHTPKEIDELIEDVWE